MLVGVIICLASVILLGLDGQFVASGMYQYVCQGRVWLLSIGFTLGYGAMFSKVWRVHRLTTKTNKNTLKVATISAVTNIFNQSILLSKLFLVFQLFTTEKTSAMETVFHGSRIISVRCNSAVYMANL